MTCPSPLEAAIDYRLSVVDECPYARLVALHLHAQNDSASRHADHDAITDRHGEVIRAHNYMVGIESLVESFEKELDPLLFEEAKAGYAKLIGRVR